MMDINLSKVGAVTVVTPQGPLIMDDAERLKGEMKDVLKNSMGRMVLDCSAVSFVDSCALEVLLDTSEQLSDMGRSLKLSGINELVREVLDLTGLADRFEYYVDNTAAARSFL